ncbi:MAG TPA: amidase family protein [Pseudonocardia sp.]|nr:amidase family protein [Pseudonocardia sp.]
MTDSAYREATAQLEDLEAKRVSARDLLREALARREAVDPALNSVVNTDIERAERDAAAIDDARARNVPLGPLAGLPMTIKDGYDVEGMPAIAGMPGLRGRPTDCPDADVVADARTAGAVIWGKTNVPAMLSDLQSFNSVYGTTNNPWDTARTPGGSSGGAAAALAAGITALEIGSDIGGSLRHPANFCGVYALKPTWDQLSMRGQVPPGPGTYINMDLGVAGPMARSVADLRLLYRVLRGTARSAASTPVTAPRDLRVAVWLEEPEYRLDDEVRRVLDTAAESLRSTGVTVVPARPPVSVPQLMTTYFGLLNSTLMAGAPDSLFERLVSDRLRAQAALADGADRYSYEAFVVDSTASFRTVVGHRTVREEIRNALATWFQEWDAVLMPIGAVPAFTHRQNGTMFQRTITVNGADEPYARMLDWIALATATHAPALAAPVGQTNDGLPVGVQLVGRWGDEERLLDLAAHLETVTDGFRPPELAIM